MKRVFALLLCVLFLLPVGCTPQLGRYTETRYEFFDTVTVLTGYAATEAAFMETAERELRTVESEDHRDALENMRSDVMEMMQVFFGLDGEKLEHFLTLSEAGKTAYLEEVLLDA